MKSARRVAQPAISVGADSPPLSRRFSCESKSLTRSASYQHGRIRICSDNRDEFDVTFAEWQKRSLILEQHHAFRSPRKRITEAASSMAGGSREGKM